MPGLVTSEHVPEQLPAPVADLDSLPSPRGDLELAGSLNVEAGGDLTIQNIALEVDGIGQRLNLEAKDNLYVGNFSPEDGVESVLGATIIAHSELSLSKSPPLLENTPDNGGGVNPSSC